MLFPMFLLGTIVGVVLGAVISHWQLRSMRHNLADEIRHELFDEFDQQFGQGFVHSTCTDGVICIYRSYKRSWGILSAGLDRDLSAKCAKSIVMNTGSH